MVNIVGYRRVDRRFEPGLQQCSPPPAPPDRGLGPLPFNLYFHIDLVYFLMSCFSYLHHHQQTKKCARAPAAVRPATAHARWEAATPPVACLCPSRRSA